MALSASAQSFVALARKVPRTTSLAISFSLGLGGHQVRRARLLAPRLCVCSPKNTGDATDAVVHKALVVVAVTNLLARTDVMSVVMLVVVQPFSV